jgi:hypothetical protein
MEIYIKRENNSTEHAPVGVDEDALGPGAVPFPKEVCALVGVAVLRECA